MNIKYTALFLLLSVGVATAGCGECFSGKSLEELEALYKEQMKEIEQELEFEQLKAVQKRYNEVQDKLSKAKLNCTAYKERSAATALLIGASQYDCDSIMSIQEEYFEIEEIKEYTKKQFNNMKSSELKALKECIIKRKAKQILENRYNKVYKYVGSRL